MELEPILRAAVERGASDVHLKAGKPPVLRYDGDLQEMEGFGVFDSFILEDVLNQVGALTPRRVAAFQETGELDTAYQIPGLPRFRVNAFRQRGDISFAFRVIPRDVPNFASLHLPPGVERLSEEHRGLVLVTGATGARQDDDARRDRRPHQQTRASSTSSRSRTRSRSCTRRELHRQPARGRASTPSRSRRRCAARSARTRT